MYSVLSGRDVCASRNSSVTSTTEASEVSLTSESSVFDSGGTAIRAACGSTIRRIACA